MADIINMKNALFFQWLKNFPEPLLKELDGILINDLYDENWFERHKELNYSNPDITLTKAKKIVTQENLELIKDYLTSPSQ